MVDAILTILLIVGIISAIIILWWIIAADMDYTHFNNTPHAVSTSEGWKEYTRFAMKFQKWFHLFQMNPSKFHFVGSDGYAMNLRDIRQNFRHAHPVFVSQSEETYYMVDFRFSSYLFYWLNRKKIFDRIHYITESKMTLELAEDTKRQIEKLQEQAQKEINESLKESREIILRLTTSEDSQTSSTSN